MPVDKSRSRWPLPTIRDNFQGANQSDLRDSHEPPLAAMLPDLSAMKITDYIQKYRLDNILISLVAPEAIPPNLYDPKLDEKSIEPSVKLMNKERTRYVALYEGQNWFCVWENQGSRVVRGRITEDHRSLG